jgi:heat shock protein HslJ
VELDGTSWTLGSGVPVPHDMTVPRPTAAFADGRIFGTSGCNRYTGGYTFDDGSFTLGVLATTRMACPPPADEIERSFLAALERVTGARLHDAELVLELDDDAEPLVFEPAGEEV